MSADLERLIFGGDRVTLDGAEVRFRERQATVLFHKPAAMTTTLADRLGRADLAGPLQSMPAGCGPVGRLDRETTGALLLTTDGDLANAVLQPGSGVPKVYRLQIDEALADDDPRLGMLLRGVSTALGVLTMDAVRIGRRRGGRVVVGGPPDRGETELWATLSAGKNRHIRRMCRRAGLRLRQLHRRSIGPVELGELAEGRWRSLTSTEVERLWAVVGRDRVRAGQRAALERQARAARELGAPNHRLEAWLRANAP